MLFTLPAFANAQKATVKSAEALIYSDADYNSEIVATLQRGGVFYVSLKPKGPFYRIRVQKGKMGWISKEDIRLGSFDKEELTKGDETAKETEQLKRPFFALRHWGPSLDYINFTESTMGENRSAWTPFVGLKWTGFNILMEGPVYFESNVLVGGAPSYYKDLADTSGDGFTLMGNFLLQSVAPRSNWLLTYYGAGPLVRYSQFSLSVADQSYDTQELTLGIVANLGMAFKLGSAWSLRFDGKYYWERERYYGLGLALGRFF